MFYYQYLYIYLLYVFFAHCKRANLNIVSLIKKCNHRRIVSPCLFIQNYYNGLLLDQYMVYVIENRTDKGSLRLPYLTISLIYFLMDDDVNLKQRMCSTSPRVTFTWLSVTFTHDSMWPSHMTHCDLHTGLVVAFTHESLWKRHTWLIVTITHNTIWPLHMIYCDL